MKNSESWKFGVQVFFSTIVIALCIFKLCTSDAKNDPNTAIYWGGLTGVLGYWLPSPNNKREYESDAASITQGSPNQPKELSIVHNRETIQS